VSAATTNEKPWWFEPVSVVLVLSGFSIYVIWAALQGPGEYLENGSQYLSPFYSPQVPTPWGWLSPAFLVLWVPLGFRATCYYYRKAYYRSFFADPPACSRPERRGENYAGETKFPFILNNLHRYFFYLAIIVMAFLWYDTILAFLFEDPVTHQVRFGVGVGSLIFLVNVILLSLYTFSCHSLRHLIGGKLDCFTCSLTAGARHQSWEKVSFINEHHMLWAWVSMFSVWSVDVYIRLLQAGIIQDLRLF
jgi:hypothetical protein